MKKTSLFLFIVCLNIAYIQSGIASAQTTGTQLQKLDSVVASDYTKYIYSYNESGQIVSEKFYVATDSVKKLFTLMNSTEHNYDNGKKLNYKNEWTSNTKTEFGYNSGNLIVRTDFHWNDTVKAWAPDTKTEYIYNTTNTNMVVYKESKYSGGGFVVVLEKEITMDRACSTDILLLPAVSNIPFKVEEEKVRSSQRLSQYYYSPHIGNGIINPTENRNALIYPNPARDFVNIQLAQFPSEPVTVKIFNNSGKLLLSQPIGNNGETISLKSFPVGIYLLQLENGRNKELVKVIKQ